MTETTLVAEAVRELYGSPAECFVAIRKASVLKARAAKDRSAATTIAALRKPTRSADLLNQLAQGEPAAIDDLLQLGGELRRAQRTADAPRLRELTARRRELVADLARLLSRFDDDITPAIRSEVIATLGAALVDDDVALGLRSGTLTKAGSWDGFGPEVSAQLTVVRAPIDEPEPAASTVSEGRAAAEPSTTPRRPGLRLVTATESADGSPDTGPGHVEPSAVESPDTEPADVEAAEDHVPEDVGGDAAEEEEPELSDRQLRDLSRAEARRLTREEEHRRREAAQAELSSLEERRAAQRTRRLDEATADARRRLDQAMSAHQLARTGLDDLDTEIAQLTRKLENLQQDRDDQEDLIERAERAVLRARTELERITDS